MVFTGKLGYLGSQTGSDLKGACYGWVWPDIVILYSSLNDLFFFNLNNILYTAFALKDLHVHGPPYLNEMN